MKPFQFRLQPVRKLREHKEEAVRETYVSRLRACEEAAALVEAASVELTGCWARVGENLAAGVSSIELLRTRAWCNVLEMRLRERGRALEQARQDVDAVWKELMLATREREALDKYYEKGRRAHNRKQERNEQKILDEMAIQTYQIPQPLRPARRVVSLA